jgi:hypothetical protein
LANTPPARPLPGIHFLHRPAHCPVLPLIVILTFFLPIVFYGFIAFCFLSFLFVTGLPPGGKASAHLARWHTEWPELYVSSCIQTCWAFKFFIPHSAFFIWVGGGLIWFDLV